MTNTATERRTTIKAERLVIESPTSNPDVSPWTVVVEEDEFTTLLHHASKAEARPTTELHVNGAVAVFLDVDGDGPKGTVHGFDRVMVELAAGCGWDMIEPLTQAMEAIRTAIDGLRAVNSVTTASRHI